MPESDQFLYRSSSEVPYFSRDGETYLAEMPLRDLKKTLPLRVLSEEDFEFWQTYGYTIIREAIPRAEAEKMMAFAFEFQGFDPNDPATWYPEREFKDELDRDLYVLGFVEAYQAQIMWDARMAQRVYDAFVDVWDTEHLWVSLDRLNLNPPNVGNRARAMIPPTERGFDINLHWDVDTTLSVLPQRVQGIIALHDSEDELGGFQCDPELFRRFEDWRLRQPADRDPVRPNIDRGEFPVVRPQLKAGDLLIWNGLVAHGVAPNQSADKCRSVQYLTMMPALPTHEKLVQSRVKSWRELMTPEWNPTLVGDVHKHESLRYGPADLTEHGRRLLGVDEW
jgi:hypothetical protein